MSATDPSYRPWAGFMDAVRESSNKMEPHYTYADTRPRPAPPVLERLSPENLVKAPVPPSPAPADPAKEVKPQIGGYRFGFWLLVGIISGLIFHPPLWIFALVALFCWRAILAVVFYLLFWSVLGVAMLVLPIWVASHAPSFFEGLIVFVFVFFAQAFVPAFLWVLGKDMWKSCFPRGFHLCLPSLGAVVKAMLDRLLPN